MPPATTVNARRGETTAEPAGWPELSPPWRAPAADAAAARTAATAAPSSAKRAIPLRRKLWQLLSAFRTRTVTQRNYILLNLFVAVILDNCGACMREEEPDIAEQDIEQFKHIWRCHSSDSTPETIPFRKLEHLLKEVGLCDGHTDDGAILGNPLAPRPRQEWTPEQLSNWTSVICQQQGVADLGVVQWLSPASVKSIIKALWVCDYACPLKSYREHILEGDAEGGTEWTESWPEMDSFGEYWAPFSGAATTSPERDGGGDPLFDRFRQSFFTDATDDVKLPLNSL